MLPQDAAPQNQISRGGAAYELAWNNNSRRYLKRGDENSALPNRTGRKNRGKRYTGAPNDNRIVPRRRHLAPARRSEEHTSELQSRGHLVCRLLLDKKKRPNQPNPLGRLAPLPTATPPN